VVIVRMARVVGDNRRLNPGALQCRADFALTDEFP
jgi:hypothetical protein